LCFFGFWFAGPTKVREPIWAPAGAASSGGLHASASQGGEAFGVPGNPPPTLAS